jgi:hypothetical protein
LVFISPLLRRLELFLVLVICRQKRAQPGDLNPAWQTSGPSFFRHFDAMEQGIDLEEIPPDIIRIETLESSTEIMEPPLAQSN